MAKMLTHSQARVVYDAVCALNSIGGILESRIDSDVRVLQKRSGTITVASRRLFNEEVYVDSAAFADAYDLDHSDVQPPAVLSFDERERILCQYISEPINHDRAMAVAIESATLARLRALAAHFYPDSPTDLGGAIEVLSGARLHGPSLAKQLDDALADRDEREAVIENLLDLILGNDRPEWSNMYAYENALIDAKKRMLELTGK